MSRAGYTACLALGIGALCKAQWEQMPGLPTTESGCVAYDVARGVVVAVDQHSCVAGNPRQTLWEWDGRQWLVRDQGQAVPPPRFGAGLCYDGAEVLLYGGQDQATRAYLGDTWSWNGRRWLHRQPVSAPSPRSGSTLGHDAVRNRVLLFGGFGPAALLNDTWEWDGSNWRLAAAQGPAYGGATGLMAMDWQSGRLTMFGLDESGATLQWDGIRWNNVAVHPVGRVSGAMAADPLRPAIVLFGGKRGSSILADTWEWRNGTWTLVNTIGSPPPMERPAMADTGRGGLLLFGGADDPGGVRRGETWLWDWTTQSWRLHEASRALPQATNRAYIGTNVMAWHGQRQSIVAYNGALGGGRGEMWEWTGTRWQPLPSLALPVPRVGPGLAYHHGTNSLVLFGGSVQGGPSLRDTWTWDGTTWTQRATPPMAFGGPAALVEDRTRSEVLLYWPTNISGDTWLWNGTSWRLAMANCPPGMRGGHALAYDEERSVVVMHGGTGRYGRDFNDTWEWDGTGWQQVYGGPFMQAGAFLMAYDRRQRKVILFGKASNAPVNETWEYQNQAWSLVASDSCFATDIAVAHDPRRGQTLMTKPYAGTWVYNPQNLLPGAQEVLLGQTLRWTLQLPQDARLPFLCALSQGADGIPLVLPGLAGTVVWPLSPDRVFRLSLGFPSLFGVLDQQGAGTAVLALPSDAALAGLYLVASAVTIDPASLAVRSVTRDARAYVVR